MSRWLKMLDSFRDGASSILECGCNPHHLRLMNTFIASLPRIRSLGLSFPNVADNLAGDEALLIQAEEAGGPPALRFWELDHLAVILGASCRLSENVRVEACQRDGVAIARRSSGGGTVVIGPGALNVTLVVPIAREPVAFQAVDTAQRFVLDRIAPPSAGPGRRWRCSARAT